MQFEETKGNFGFQLLDADEDPHIVAPVVQMYVKSSRLSRAADLAISNRLTSDTAIDQFIDEAIASLQVLRADAKAALAKATKD